MPSIVTTATLEAPPADVWRMLTDFPAWEQWNPMMRSMVGRPEVGSRLRIAFVLRLGGRVYRTPAKVLACEPERELRWGGGVPGLVWVEHWVKLAPDGAGTALEHGESFRGLLAGVGLRLVRLDDAPYRAMNAALADRVRPGQGIGDRDR